MPSAKYPYEIRNGLKARLTISLELPRNLTPLAEAMGIGKQELENLLGQKFQEIVDNLGLEESGGIGG